MKNEKLMREGSVAELLLKMSLPVILVMMVTVLYNLADVFFIGRLRGDDTHISPTHRPWADACHPFVK